MSSSQFIHVEVYARKAGAQKSGGHNLASIVAEAEREPGACPHISEPKPPVLVHGCLPNEAARLAAEWAQSSKDARGRSLRIDGLCMLAGTVSLERARDAIWREFLTHTVAWLKGIYACRLISIVEHKDEEHPHLHFYCVPAMGERFEVLHPGRLAASEALRQGKPKGAQNSAYKSAMRVFQNTFWLDVASKFGLTRVGPQRRRLSRKAWREEQALTSLYASAHRAADVAIEIRPAAKFSELEFDRDAILNSAGAATKHVFGPDTYTEEQLISALNATCKAISAAVRKDESSRWAPVLELARGAKLLQETIKQQQGRIRELESLLHDLKLFSNQEIVERRLAIANRSSLAPTQQNMDQSAVPVEVGSAVVEAQNALEVSGSVPRRASLQYDDIDPAR